jgi:hypothetical protein
MGFLLFVLIDLDGVDAHDEVTLSSGRRPGVSLL